jgi:hypothetical protein
MKEKTIIGRSDRIDFPDLHLSNVEAKIDTGAFTSAIHYHRAEEIERNGKKVLHFTLLDPAHPEFNGKNFYLSNYNKRIIKNSFGESEERYIIPTTIVLFGNAFKAEFSLSNRGNLKFPILLGRKLLEKGFIVDVSKKNLSYKKKQRNEDRNTFEKQ